MFTKNILRKIAISNFYYILLSFIIVGCSAPGAPHLRTNTNDGEGPLITGCYNISSATIVNDYITNYYQSTWGSVWQEGNIRMISEAVGLVVPPEIKNRDDLIKWYINKGILQKYSNVIGNKKSKDDSLISLSINLDQLLFTETPYCRAYKADALDVSREVSRIITKLGGDILLSDINRGLFITGFIEHYHNSSLDLLHTRWKDRYIITVTQKGSIGTIVKVLRELYISRDNGPFDKAIAAGHNEAWILTKIAEAIKQ